MAITPIDTHKAVKDLAAAGFTQAQAEALADLLREAQDIDLSHLVTKADLAIAVSDLRGELIRWIVGIGFAQVALILAVLKLFSAGPP
ncbi:MAG: DUF1640 domain-containing protein [Alphaproteobacteria bacterium]|nr:DUF1640 domain-containing protein [Alphaproteobacteria bacterium]MBV9863165.1 DUF1640 domain-containing protein [Alphaproteobacteria bacterium]